MKCLQSSGEKNSKKPKNISKMTSRASETVGQNVKANTKKGKRPESNKNKMPPRHKEKTIKV